jgi:hypothetical protein
MNANRAGLNIGEPVWTHERVARSRSIQDALESLAIVSRYQRDEEIYPQQGGVECWYGNYPESSLRPYRDCTPCF